MDDVGVEAATAAGILVAKAPLSHVLSVAALTVGLIAAAARQFVVADAALRAGRRQLTAGGPYVPRQRVRPLGHPRPHRTRGRRR